MADAIKAQKLAAAKKKLKEYQQKGQKPTKNALENEENLIAFENLSNSTHSAHSSINDNFDCSNVPSENVSKPSPFHNYFNENHTSVTYAEPNNFFDSLQENTNNLLGQFNAVVNKLEEANENDNLTVIKDVSIENSEIIQNDEDSTEERLFVFSEDAKKLSDFIEQSNNKEDQGEVVVIRDEPVVENDEPNLRVENLLQSSQPPTNGEFQKVQSLEIHNQELTALLDLERSKSKNLNVQLEENINKVVSLENELRQSKLDLENRLSRELGPLQEQLQYHTQTFGILVAEKTELMASLSQSQLTVKQKIIDCEELQGRLKTSRSRVVDLEKELQIIKSERDNFQKNHNCKEENDKIVKEFQDLLEKKEEISQELLETREKLNIKVNENLAIQRELQEATHRLSLAQVKISQITAGESLQVESQVEILNQQKLTLEKQIVELNDSLKATTNERDQASIQYQHYVQQLNGQVTALASKLESVTSENESFSKREQNLVKHIGELEKHLQNVQEEQLNFAGGKSTINEVKKQLDLALESSQNLEKENAKLEENYREIFAEKEELLHELMDKKNSLELLNSQVERLQGNQPDNAKLLAEIESDKVAASRAVAQNTQLKQQLEEMQQAFVKSSNDKLELAERLTSEEFRNKELSEKLTLIQNQLHTLTEALTIKDNELTNMREASLEQNKQILMQDQLSDRLRHYEAQFGSVQAMQNELQDSQNVIRLLTAENLQFKKSFSDQTDSQLKTDDAPVSLPQNTVGEIEKVNSECQTISENVDATNVSHFDKEVAMKRLEEKFTRTMQDVANLSEEKQRLEHIVTQLQGETETIGEYIALYQHQRGILKQRTQEKDEQLRRLAEDRQKVRTKLDALNLLVKKLMIEKGDFTPEMLEQHNGLNSYAQELCSEHAKLQEEMGKIAKTATTENGVGKNDNNNVSAETAEEIISLLAEIKASNLIQPSDSFENFHPCSWCSGQLLTV